MLTLGGPLLPEALAAVAAGVPGTPQPVEGSYAPMVTEAERNLDWNRSAVQLRNQVRAWGSHRHLEIRPVILSAAKDLARCAQSLP